MNLKKVITYTILVCSILNCSSTTHFGVTKEEFNENPDDYAVLHVPNAAFAYIYNVDDEETGVGYPKKIYLSPGSHTIAMSWIINKKGGWANDEAKAQSITYNFRPEIYTLVCPSEVIKYCSKWSIAPKKIETEN